MLEALSSGGLSLPTTATRDNDHEYSINIYPERTVSTEEELIQYTFDAFNTNILSVIDKYWSIRYKGKIDLPLNLSMALRGGDIQEGGSVFDSTILHDQTFSAVIPEAVPFYLCACNICEYYINNFGGKIDDGADYKLHLKINKISSLYPVYEIYGKYKATTKSLTCSTQDSSLSVQQILGTNKRQRICSFITLHRPTLQ